MESATLPLEPASSNLSRPLGRRRGPVADRLLTLAARQGSRGALEAICARYQGQLQAYCTSLLGNADDAADAAQSTLTKAIAQLPGESRDIDLRPWLYRIAHNEAVSMLRRRGREVPIDDRIETVEDSARHVATEPEAVLAARERLATLVRDLERLPEQQRGALVMRELGGLGHDEIAAALGISTGAAKQTIYEARSALTEAAAGRDLACSSVREAISARDGRILRRRGLRAHLRACDDCESFRAAISTRRADLGLLAGPAVVAGPLAGLREVLLGGKATATGAPGSGAGSIGVAGAIKGIVAVAVTASAVSVATGGGVVPGFGGQDASTDRVTAGPEGHHGGAADGDRRATASSRTADDEASAKQARSRKPDSAASAGRTPTHGTGTGAGSSIGSPTAAPGVDPASGPPITPPAGGGAGQQLGTGTAQDFVPEGSPAPELGSLPETGGGATTTPGAPATTPAPGPPAPQSGTPAAAPTGIPAPGARPSG